MRYNFTLILQKKGISMIKKSILSLFLLSSLLFQGCFDEEKKVEDANAMVSTNEFVLTTLKNKQIIVKKTEHGFIVEGNRDKIIMFDVFATWCPPCQAEAPHLGTLQKKYKDKLLIIGLTIENAIPNAKLEQFKKQHNATYTFANSAQNRALITEIADMLQLGDSFPIPMMAMYKDGELVQHYIGAVEEEFIESDIKQALKK